MQRRIISVYERRLSGFTRWMLPRPWRAALAGALFRLTQHPDLGFRHARHLVALGKGRRAATLYAGEGHTALDDPLFDAQIAPVGATKLHVEFGYRGLWLGGSLPACDWVEIRVDGCAVRRETLRGKLALRYIIGRDALALFAPRARLEVVADTGDLLGAWDVSLPHGQGGLEQAIANAGTLEKKGGLRPDPQTLAARQDAYLALYARVNAAFMAEFGKPVFILYWTLLGQHRSGDFIKGDDDFDVGYVSLKTTFAEVRDEAVDMIERLVARGFIVALNAEGKPFRIRDDLSGPDIWLDNRPVFCPSDGHVWLHKQARLPLPLDDFTQLSEGTLRGCAVLKPRDSEAFLAAYYGAGWRVPDPSFSNASKGVDPLVLRGLASVNLTLSQQKTLLARATAQNLAGSFDPLALRRLYPLVSDDSD